MLGLVPVCAIASDLDLVKTNKNTNLPSWKFTRFDYMQEYPTEPLFKIPAHQSYIHLAGNIKRKENPCWEIFLNAKLAGSAGK